jgi:hypothetical protein
MSTANFKEFKYQLGRHREGVMHRKLRLIMLTVGIPALLVGLAAPATADPSRAPNLILGAIAGGSADCGEAGLSTFIATQTNPEPTTWSPLFFTRSEDGATGLFIPASFDVEVTNPDGTSFRFSATKGAAPGPESCHFKARTAEGFLPTVFGDMTAKSILTG